MTDSELKARLDAARAEGLACVVEDEIFHRSAGPIDERDTYDADSVGDAVRCSICGLELEDNGNGIWECADCGVTFSGDWQAKLREFGLLDAYLAQ